MFSYTTEAFGDFEKHILSNRTGQALLACTPSHGSILVELSLNGIQLLDAPLTPEELRINRWYKNTLLYPFPNRLKDGHFHWAGKDYHFPINEPSTDTALHGFGATRKMQLLDQKTTKETASITLGSQYIGDNEAFPFPFDFQVKYELIANNSFLCTFRVTNKASQPIPMGLGWHPYFQISDSVESIELQLPKCSMVGIDQRMLPTGKLYEYKDFAKAKKIGATVLDNCFKLHESGEQSIFFSSKKGKFRYFQDANKFPYVQLFTPPYRTSIAIEPMSCNIDAFHNTDGLIVLEENGSWQGSFGLEAL